MRNRTGVNNIYEEDDHAILEVDSPKFGLFKFLIDKEDMERCKSTYWTILHDWPYKKWKEYFYAAAVVDMRGEIKRRLLHRYLINAPDGMLVDHVNSDTLDNRKANLRLCTQSENSKHRQPHRNNTSGIKGVGKVLVGKKIKWAAYAKMNNVLHNIGVFKTIEEAAEARRKFVLENYGDFLPVELEETINQ